MEPTPRRHPPRPSGALILGTGLALVLAFGAVIALFFMFSAFVPSLTGKCVAVVNVDMPLTVEGQPPSLFDAGYAGSDELATSISSIGSRDDVGAVLFVFNSPGGSVVATREVYDSIKGLDKPKVAYFREVAASGAYYAATGTDYIVSDPDAITGSIGVIATFTDMSGLLEKLGVNVTAVKSGPHKDIGSEFRNMTPEEEKILQSLIDEIYQEFRSVVVENRRGRLNMAQFEQVTDGRILSGRQALRAGLVDAVGTKNDAVMKAAELGGMEAGSASDVRLCPVESTPSEGGLFSMEGILRGLKMGSGVPSLQYK